MRTCRCSPGRIPRRLAAARCRSRTPPPPPPSPTPTPSAPLPPPVPHRRRRRRSRLPYPSISHSSTVPLTQSHYTRRSPGTRGVLMKPKGHAGCDGGTGWCRDSGERRDPRRSEETGVTLFLPRGTPGWVRDECFRLEIIVSECSSTACLLLQ